MVFQVAMEVKNELLQEIDVYEMFLYAGFTKGYVFDGDTERVFREFFGGDNPFIGTSQRLKEKGVGVCVCVCV